MTLGIVRFLICVSLALPFALCDAPVFAQPKKDAKKEKGAKDKAKDGKDKKGGAPAEGELGEASSSALDRVQSLSSEATTAFESYSFRKAKQKLDEAVRVAAEAGVAKHKDLASVHVLLAIADVSGSNDLYRGLYDLVAALRIDPRIEIPKAQATPQLLDLFSKAKKAVAELAKPPVIRLVAEKVEAEAGSSGLRGAAAEKGEPSDAKVEGQGLIHVPVDSAKRGLPIPMKVQTGIDIQAQKVFLYYRTGGSVEFTRIEMQKGGNSYRATIPAASTMGRYLHYYIEAKDQRGRLAATKHTARSPSVLIIEP